MHQIDLQEHQLGHPPEHRHGHLPEHNLQRGRKTLALPGQMIHHVGQTAIIVNNPDQVRTMQAATGPGEAGVIIVEGEVEVEVEVLVVVEAEVLAVVREEAAAAVADDDSDSVLKGLSTIDLKRLAN